eukprot:10296499-Prorocentrum_lima.AAC.1
MTSSLVGSEMCIRDSSCGLPWGWPPHSSPPLALAISGFSGERLPSWSGSSSQGLSLIHI